MFKSNALRLALEELKIKKALVRNMREAYGEAKEKLIGYAAEAVVRGARMELLASKKPNNNNKKKKNEKGGGERKERRRLGKRRRKRGGR